MKLKPQTIPYDSRRLYIEVSIEAREHLLKLLVSGLWGNSLEDTAGRVLCKGIWDLTHKDPDLL
jgi:hypothetical protein